ncbi:MAG: 1-deoxy-D-xylulose-5-phosphate reductoisomerase [bacterium]
MTRQSIALLGSTGSIGVSTLDVVAAHPDRFEVVALSASKNIARLVEQIRRFRPRRVALLDEALAHELARSRDAKGVEVFAGAAGLLDMIRAERFDICVNALVGAAGLVPTIAAIAQCRRLAIANKESLVVAGEIVMREAQTRGVEVLPVDSEHAALHQCLEGRSRDAIARVILTASGGPFRELTSEAIARVTVEQALRHPTWKMGEKITIDSATLFNKGIELIEAKWLFGLPHAALEVVVHPESIVHAMIELADGTIIAQLSAPDMRLPIQYALAYPERLAAPWPRLDLARAGALHFEPPDPARFPCLTLAYDALVEGGTMPAVLNAANEVAVNGFLGELIPFGRIPEVIERVMARHDNTAYPDLETILAADRWARETAETFLEGAEAR